MPSSKIFRTRQIFSARICIRGVIIIFYYIYYLSDKLDCVRSADSLLYLRYIKPDYLYDIKSFSKSDFIKIDKERARLNTKKNRINKKT